MYVNTVAVVGNLTSDPKMGQGDSNVVNLRIAVNGKRRKNRNQPEYSNESTTEERHLERTEFIDVECWGPQAKNVLSSLKKGDRAIVIGKMKYDQWTDDAGNLRSRLCVRAEVIGASLEFECAKVGRE